MGAGLVTSSSKESVNGEKPRRTNRRQSMSAAPSSVDGNVTYEAAATGSAESKERRRERRKSIGMKTSKSSDRPSSSQSSPDEKKRSSGENRKNGEGQTKSPRRTPEEDANRRLPSATNQGSGTFVPPPSIADLTNGVEEKREDRRASREKKSLSKAASERHLDRNYKKSHAAKRT